MYNVITTTYSNSVGYVLADVPVTPTLAPTSDLAVTDTKVVKIDLSAVAVGDDGGSPITSYSLEVDDGKGG